MLECKRKKQKKQKTKNKEVDFNRRKMQKEDSAAPATQQPTTYDHFLQSHRSQLEGVGLPESLWKVKKIVQSLLVDGD